MNNIQRAKQFMPFAALKGFEEAVKAQERLREPKVILGEDARQELNFKLQGIQPGDRLRAEYYYEGRYVTVRGQVKRIDSLGRRIHLEEIKIPIDDLKDIEREV